MEMEFKDPGRRRRVVLIVLGVALALAAGWGAFMLSQNGSSTAQVIRESVLVAARDIPARTQLTPDDVVVRQVPIDEVLGQTYREAEIVIGRVSAVPIYSDQQITPNLFATTSADSDFSILGPDEVVTATSPYWRAVAIEVPANRAVGGEIRAGQHVDVVVSVEIQVLTVDEEGDYQRVETASDDGLQGGKSTKITFQDIEVLKADADAELYVLKVDLHQAEEIAHIVQVAPDSFSLVLRPDEDTRQPPTLEYGETTDRLVMQYLFPAPQLIDLSQLVDLPLPPGQVGTTGPTPTPAPDASAEPEEPAEPTPTPTP